jgi:hypothetical protein
MQDAKHLWFESTDEIVQGKEDVSHGAGCSVRVVAVSLQTSDDCFTSRAACHCSPSPFDRAIQQ